MVGDCATAVATKRECASAPPDATTAARRFDDHGIANLAGQRRGFVRRLDRPFTAGKNRYAGGFHRITSRDFLAHQSNDVRSRTDKLDIAGFANLSEVGRLSQKSIAGVNGINVKEFRGADDGRYVQITLRRGSRPDADVFVGETHVQ